MSHVATYFTNARMCELTFAVYAQALAEKRAQLQAARAATKNTKKKAA